MYDDPKVFEGKLNAYQHEDRGVEVRCFSAFCFCTWQCRSIATRISYRLILIFCLSQRGRAKDPVAFLQSVEQRARERQVAYETVKLLRQRVIHCYRKEGVNHYEKCKKEAQDLYNVISQKDLGQLQPNQTS
jgi:hypothetical protein